MRRKTEIILHKITGFPFYEFQPASIFRRFYFWLQESWNNDLKSVFVSSITKYLNKQRVTFYICWGSSSDNLFVWILRTGCTKTPLTLVQLSLVLAHVLIDNLKCLFFETGKHGEKNNFRIILMQEYQSCTVQPYYLFYWLTRLTNLTILSSSWS